MFTATTSGDEMDEVNIVTVHAGLKIFGATTSAVRSQFDAPYENFQGIVFAEFKGDFRKVVKELGLKKAGSKDQKIGEYVAPRPTGAQDEICPPTVALTPLDDGRFVLGCGWCNG